MANKIKLEVGQVLYGVGYKTKDISFCEELIIGLKILKPKIKRVTEKYITLNVKGDEQRISKERLGVSIFTTEKGIIEFIIKENKRRIEEKVNSNRKQHLDIEHLEAMRKDLKKWQKKQRDALVSGDEQ